MAAVPIAVSGVKASVNINECTKVAALLGQTKKDQVEIKKTNYRCIRISVSIYR